MRTFPRMVLLAALLVAFSTLSRTPATAQSSPADLSGAWVLDRDLSQFPKEVGFGAVVTAPGLGDATGGSSRGGRRGGGLQPSLRPGGESYDDGRRRQILSDEARTPPARLTIVDTPTVVTITDDKGQVRTLHPGGPAEALALDNVTVLTIATREENKLVVLYAVEDLRQIRYTYSRSLGGGPLMVDVQFLERGNGEVVRRVYKSASLVPAATASGAGAGGGAGVPPGAPPGFPGRPPAGSAANAPGTPGTPGTPGSPGAGGGGGGFPDRVPAAGSGGPVAMPRNGSEYKGLARMGLVLEDLGPQAAACGLKRETLLPAITKYFTDAGIRMVRDADDDTYLYVRIMTSTMSGGTCVSRFDWTIYSTTGATLSYQKSPLLLQVELARRGGLVGSAPATHGNDVMQQMGSTLGPIAATIRDANK